MRSSEGVSAYDPDADHLFPDTAVNNILSVLTTDPKIPTSLDVKNVTAVNHMSYSDRG